MNEFTVKILVYFFSKIIYIHLYHVSAGIKIYIPNMLGKFSAGNYTTLISQKISRAI